MDNIEEVSTEEISIEGPVTSRWEACAGFAADHPGSSVCAGCGWLEHEHRLEAIVYRLPTRTTTARRLAS